MARGTGWLAAAFGAALWAVAGMAAAQDAWHTMTGPDRSFTADLPAAPKYTPSNLGTPAGIAYTMHQYQLDQGPVGYVVQYVEYPRDINVSNPQQNLQAGLNVALKSMDGGKWVSTDFLKHQGLPAAEAIGVRGGNDLRLYSVLKGRRLFSLIYVGPPGTARSPDVDRFIASLKVGS